MILILLSTIFLIPALMGWGKIMENILGPMFEGISAKILSGILGISLIWTVLSFFIPLNISVEIPTLLLGFFNFFRNRLYHSFYSFSKTDFSLILIASGVILFSGSFYPYILDHFGYYVPTVQWLREFGLVKGISNLDLTLGQMSVWHIFQAGFSNFSDPFLRINSILLIVYSVYSLERKSWIQLCFVPVMLLFSQSPSPDLPVIVFSLIILNEIIHNNKNTSLLFAFSVFVLVIKPTMIWVPILSFLYSVFIVRPNFKHLIPGIFIIALFFIKNIWTFGYPVFPVAIGDLGIYWKPAPEVLKTSSQYAIQKTYDMQYSYAEIQKFSTLDYIRNWIFLDGIKSKINILFILSLLLFTVFTFIKKSRIITFIWISLLIKTILVLLFSAQYRFFTDVFFVIFFLMFLSYFNQKKSVIVFSSLSLFFIVLLSFPKLVKTYLPSFNPGNFMGTFKTDQLYQPSVYEPTDYDTFRVGNLKFNVSRKYPYNYKTPVPAISSSFIFDDEKAGIFPQLINEHNIKEGFIWKNLNSKEKKEAQSIINSINNSYQ
ncbi:LIC_10190 family membrane protein [Chryseobacterium sp. JUb7]|uniref:LIC_10190 family membrane protein n=1 Tax=Chryseobacterium sp. JUb7 TaxID=2940599 RepID=UPI00216998A0|nr:hypothetical protein [Chryseobacterium sp. JUb7]